MTFEEKVKKAKLKFFTKDLIFFGIQSYKFNWVFEEFDEDTEGYVTFDVDDPNLLVNGAININKKYVNKSDYTYTNLVFIVCHELLHILNRHGIRKIDRRHDVWCVACDHVIETELKGMRGIIQPYEDRYNIIPELSQALPNCSAEQAYAWLMQNKSFATRIQYNQQTGQIEVKDQNGEVMFTVNPQQGGADKKGNSTGSGNMEMKVEQIISESRALFNELKSRGNIPSNMKAYLDKILEVKIPWDQLLEKAIKTSVILKPDDRSWRCLNRYYMPHRLTLPGYALTEESDGVGTLIIHVDRSGSVSHKELKKFAYVMQKSMTYFKKILVMVHDVTIHQEEEFDKDNIAKFYKFIKDGLVGGGGTSHKYVFEKTQTLWDEDPDNLSLVIALTDNESDIQHIYKKYEWIKNNLPFVILSTTTKIDLDENFGSIDQIIIE